MKKIYWIIGISVFLIIGIIQNSNQNQHPTSVNVPSNSYNASNSQSPTSEPLIVSPLIPTSNPVTSPKTTSTCVPLKYGLDKPNTNIQFSLFLQETSKRGFEGIVSKRIENSQLHYYVNTNLLPPESSPYYLWVANIDRNGNICSAINVGQLTREPRFGAWLIDFGDNYYNDDGQFFVITYKGFGGLKSDKLTTLDSHNPMVILTGSFSQISKVSNVKL
jgi:hypothetical protein